MSVQDLFARRRAGHYIQHCYETAGQLTRWSRFMQTEGYYVTRHEPALIPLAAFEAHKLLGDGREFTGIENGPGTGSAVALKTIPFFKRVGRMKTYVARDWSPEVCEGVRDLILGAFPGIRVVSDLANFNEDLLPSGLSDEQKVFAEFGFSRTNLEGMPDQPYPIDLLTADAKHLRRLMNVGDVYAMSIDANADEASILKSYSGDEIVEWGREHLRRMKIEFSIEGDFHPESFTTKPLWFRERWLCNNNFVPLRRMEFRIAGEEFCVYPGECFPFTNQWKIPLDVVLSVYAASGFQLQALPKDEYGWVNIPVFQAI